MDPASHHFLLRICAGDRMRGGRRPRPSFSRLFFPSFLLLLLLVASGCVQAEDPVVLNPQLQVAAFKALSAPRRLVTGQVYNVTLPPGELDGIRAQAVRLRTGSLRRRGLVLNEFTFPAGVVLRNLTLRSVVLVYRNLGNRSSSVYSAVPAGYQPFSVVGILVYDAANLSSTEPLPELSLQATRDPISLRFVVAAGGQGQELCAAFDSGEPGSLPNTTAFTGACAYDHLGDFTLLLPLVPGPASTSSSSSSSSSSNAWKIAVGVIGGVVGLVLLLAFLLFLLLLLRHLRYRSKMKKMQLAAERGETLQTTLIGNSRAPAAGGSRTKPVLETDYVA